MTEPAVVGVRVKLKDTYDVKGEGDKCRGISDAGDELGADFDTLHLQQKPLHLTHHHASCIQGDDLFVKAVKRRSCFGIKRGVKLPWRSRNVEGQRLVIGQNGLGALAITVVGNVLQLGPTGANPDDDSFLRPRRFQ